ncbi:MAG: hypothetical protein AB1801_13060 [Chloroflexota bacterium]
MQALTDFLNSARGRHFLESNGVFIDRSAFEEQLQLPAKSDLAGQLNQPNKKLICSGQQIYVDYRRSVLSKIEVLQDMAQHDGLFGFFLWVDTDRSGSDNLITKFAWPNFSKKGPITIMPARTREIESRFVELDNAVLMSAIDKLETYLRQYAQPKPGAKERFMRLRSLFVDENHHTLSAFNLRLTNFLLADVYGYTPLALMLSDMLTRPAIIAELELFVNNLEPVVAGFNEAVEAISRQGLDPQVTPLDEHYFPLFLSCEVDNQRLRLYHSTEGDEHFAGGRCRCGQTYKFYLGRQELSLAEIIQTGRWSPDVCFPIFFNDRVSGFVAGKSSGVYLMVLNAVMRRALDKTPVPILLPPGLGTAAASLDEPDSLIYTYMIQ